MPTVLAVCLLSFGLQAQDEPLDKFDSWDGNRDGVITNEEFTTVWDQQDYFRNWDMDGDGVLNEDEWNEGVETYYSLTDDWENNRNRNFSSWDTDRNGSLNEDEFRQGTYNTWDMDGNGSVNDTEYHNYSNTLAGDRRY